MKSRDYREIQLSSSHLVFIFIGILILGVVIFLLGVSVGKKQAQIVKETGISSLAKIEDVKEKATIKPKEAEDAISKELASYQKIKQETQKKPAGEQKENIYYVQVGAFKNKEAARSFAERFEKKGYPSLVLNPLSSDKNPVYRVRIGDYPTKEKAEDIRQKLAQSERKKKSDYFIVRK